LLLVVNTLLF